MKPRPPLFMLLFVSIFGVIGLGLLFFLWFGSSEGLERPPLIFRFVGSCIALAFVIMGFGVPLTALLGRTTHEPYSPQPNPPSPEPGPKGYKCPHCGAGLDDAEVSPSGDVKCRYCHKWYNIHHRST